MATEMTDADGIMPAPITVDERLIDVVDESMPLWLLIPLELVLLAVMGWCIWKAVV